ncbi:MAG: hypothetical protein ACU0BF_01735 [Paracoccaceae bacterium]
MSSASTIPPEPLIDLSVVGGPGPSTAAQLMALVASGKRKVLSGPNGWSSVSQHELVAMGWLLELIVRDAPEPHPTPAGDAS